ncbi:MAG TPA: MFS transporter [Dehalococcoidia bacterium]|nr:MFS transporter [Dehalococcoidia bacterium]
MTLALPVPRGAFDLLLSHRPYRLYFASSSMGAFASAVEFIALGWLVVELSPGVLGVAAFFAIRFGAKVLLAVPAGLAADRYPRVTLYASMRVMSGLAALLGAGALLTAWPLEVALLAAGLSAAAHAMDLPAHRALQGDIYPRERLEQAISFGTGGFHIATLLAPIVALPLATVFGPGMPLLVAGAAFFMASMPAFRLPSTRVERVAATAKADVLAAVGFVARTPLVLGLLLAGCVPSVVDKCVTVMLPSSSGNEHGAFGVVLAAPEMGAIAIGFGLAAVPWRFSPWIPAVCGAAYVASVAAVSFAGLAMGPASIGLALFAGGCAKTGLMASAMAGMQRLVPAEMRGRVMTV